MYSYNMWLQYQVDCQIFKIYKNCDTDTGTGNFK